MTSRERIGTAQFTDDLGERPVDELADVDIIRSCGMAGQANPLGLAIWRWRVGGDMREIFHVAKGLIELGHASEMVGKVLGHLANDVCLHCNGRGYEVMPGTPMLSDVLCVHCQGTGRRPLHGELENAIRETIARYEREFAAAVMKKLSRSMEF